MTVRQDKERGTWYFVVDAPGVGGKRHQVRRRGFPTKKAAQVAERELLATVDSGRFVRQARGTLGEYLVDTWLPSRHDLRESTRLGYEKIIHTRIIPKIGDHRLVALDAATLERFYGELIHSGGVGGKGLSWKTVSNVAGVLSIALADAVRLRTLPHNVANDARVPRGKRPELMPWTEDEAVTFLASVADDRVFALWRLVLSTGMRRGELCGLRWQDVDLDAGTVTVASTRVVARLVVTGPPKTTSGERVVALDADTVRALRSWRGRQASERLAAGEAWHDSGLVFVDELGRPPHPETVTRWWREAIERAGVRPIRLHDARHTAATVLLRAGVPVKVVSQRIGHADVAVTMRIYQHVTAQDDQAAADAIAAAFDRKV
jgi:integrase